MHGEPEPRRGGLDGLIVTAIVLALLSYLGIAGLQGEHGLFRLIEIEAQEVGLRKDLAALQAERAVIENRTRRLSSGTLDLDLLDEQARRVLGLGREDEILIR